MTAVASGWCDPRFTAVGGQFAANFADRGETGAAACVSVHGTVVADLWGGWLPSAIGARRACSTGRP